MMIPYVRLEEGRKELPFDCGDKDLKKKDTTTRKTTPDSESTFAMYYDLSRLKEEYKNKLIYEKKIDAP